MNIPPDLNDPNNPNQPPADPNALDPNALDPSMMLKGKPRSKTPMIVIGLAIAGVAGFFIFKSVQDQNRRKLHAAFMESFADAEHDEVGKFWTCILGNNNVDPGQVGPNLGNMITSRFGVDAKNYPQKVREECAPKAIDAKHKIEELSTTGPAEYGDALKKYEAALKSLSDAFIDWAKVAPAQVADMEMAKRVENFGNAWHSFAGGKPGNDVIAFDQFFHCAVPGLDGMKDGQGVVEYIFNQCKNPAYSARVNDECGKMILSDMPGAPTKNFVSTLKKMAADSRELEAFDDCMRKGRKGKRSNDFGEVASAYNAWMDAGAEVRKVGKEMLKN